MIVFCYLTVFATKIHYSKIAYNVIAHNFKWHLINSILESDSFRNDIKCCIIFFFNIFLFLLFLNFLRCDLKIFLTYDTWEVSKKYSRTKYPTCYIITYFLKILTFGRKIWDLLGSLKQNESQVQRCEWSLNTGYL